MAKVKNAATAAQVAQEMPQAQAAQAQEMNVPQAQAPQAQEMPQVDAKKAKAQARKQAAQARKEQKQAERAKAQAARQTAIDNIAQATAATAAQACTLSALIAAAIVAAKQAGTDSVAFSVIRSFIERGGGTLDISQVDATRTERAAYLRALSAVYPVMINGKFAESKRVYNYMDADGKRRNVYAFAPVEKWTAAKVVRRPLLAILRNETRRNVLANTYYTDGTGGTAFRSSVVDICAASKAYDAAQAAQAEQEQAKQAAQAAQAAAFIAAPKAKAQAKQAAQAAADVYAQAQEQAQAAQATARRLGAKLK